MATFGFVVANYTGHVHSMLHLARGLKERGHRVVFFAEEATAPKVEFHGYTCHRAPFLQSLSIQGATEGGTLLSRFRTARREGERRKRAISTITEATRDLVKAHAPDVLVFDPFLLAYAIAFHPHKIPVVALSTKPLLDFDPVVPPYTSPAVPSAGLRGHVVTRAAWAACWARYGSFRAAALRDLFLLGVSSRTVIKQLAQVSGYPLQREWHKRPVSFDFCLKSVPELVLSTPEFDFPRARPLRSSAHYVGPCVDLERREAPLEEESLPQGRHLVFCSLGTVDKGRDGGALSLLRRIIMAVRGDPDIALIVATGDEASATRLSPGEPNVAVRAHVPQLEILKRAEVMLTHGGASSIKECILLDTVPIVYPRRADQPGNSARVLYHQLGLRGSTRQDSPTKIRQRIRQALNEKALRLKLRVFRDAFRSYDGRAVALLEEQLERAPLLQEGSTNPHGAGSKAGSEREHQDSQHV